MASAKIEHNETKSRPVTTRSFTTVFHPHRRLPFLIAAMGQYWDIINLDKREKVSDFSEKLACYLIDDRPNGFAMRLLPPKWNSSPVFLPTSSMKSNLPIRIHPSRRCVYCSPFIDEMVRDFARGMTYLPVELIDEIFVIIPELPDVVCLGLTCQTLWNIGRRRMETHVQQIAEEYSWAGDRIICVGDYLKGGDLPEGVLTDEEIAELSDPASKTVAPADDHETTTPETPASLYRLKGEYASSKDPYMVLSRFHIKLLAGFAWPRTHYPRFNEADIAIFHQLCDENAWNFSTTERPFYALRNLSRHMYVSERAWSQETAVSGLGRVWFGHFVLIRICWSSDPGTNLSCRDDISRGVWAGDRFDIVAEDDFLDELKESPDPVTWKDASDEVFREVERIWEADGHV